MSYDPDSFECPKLLPGGIRTLSVKVLETVESDLGVRLTERLQVLDKLDHVVGDIYASGRRDEARAALAKLEDPHG